MATESYTIKKQKMLEALTRHLGVVSDACKEVDIARQTHYKWLKNDPKYKEVVDDMNDVLLDFAEAHLFNLIKKGDTTATIFLLKTKGKGRGYIERVDHDITSKGEKIIPVIKFSDDRG